MPLMKARNPARSGAADPIEIVKRGIAESEPDQQKAILRVAMIGCGEIAYNVTGPALKAARNAKPVLVMDVDARLAASMGRACGVPHTTDLQRVLRHPAVDAVLISTPHDQHRPLVVAAAAAGKHVMCEKPIACTLEQADDMIVACQGAGVHLGINMVARYEAVTRAARALLASGAIGRVIGLNVHFTIRKPDTYWDGGFTGRAASPWRRFRTSAGGGVLMTNMIHELDRLYFVSGLHATSVGAEIATLATDVEVEDTAVVNYVFSNGALGSITASSCAPGNRSFGLQIMGTEGQIIFGAFAAGLLRETIKKQGRTYTLRRILPSSLLGRLNRGTIQVFTTKDMPGLKRHRWTKVKVSTATDPRRLYIESFADAVLLGLQPDIGGEQARDVLAAVLGAYEAARAGTRVMIRSADVFTPPALCGDQAQVASSKGWQAKELLAS